MRVALLTPEVAPGYGWARYALELATALIDQGVHVVALTQASTQTGADLDPASLPLADVRPVLPHLVPPTRAFVLRSVLARRAVCRAIHDCDLLHVVAEPYSLLGAWTADSRPLVITAHGTYVPQTVHRPGVGMLYRRAYRRAHLVAVSDYTAARVRATLPDAALTVIRNGVHAARFQAPAPAPRKHVPTILATGGIKQRKGTHLLIDALDKVRQHVPDAQLVITGRQDDLHYLALVERQIADLGLGDAVHLLGMIGDDDLRGWYQHADVFVLPSLNVGERFEGFGLVFLEASAAGLPVIGTHGSGVAEAVIDGETGLLVPQNDAITLADAITRVLTDADLRARLGAAGGAYAQTQDWSQVAAHMVALYRQVLA